MKNSGSTKRAVSTTKERAKDLKHRDVGVTEQTKVGGGLISLRSEVASVSTGGAFPAMTDGKPTTPCAFPSSGAATRA